MVEVSARRLIVAACACAATRSLSTLNGASSLRTCRAMAAVFAAHAAARAWYFSRAHSSSSSSSSSSSVAPFSLQDRLFSPAWVSAATAVMLISGAAAPRRGLQRVALRGLRFGLTIVTPGLVWKAFMETANPEEESDPCALMALVLSLLIGGSRNLSAAGVILIMLTGGEALEEYALRRAGDGMRALIRNMRVQGKIARLTNGTSVAVTALGKGDILRMSEGETVPADGDVVSHASSTLLCDESAITGEHAVVRKRVGDMIYSGTVLVRGTCNVKLRRSARDSVTGLIRQELEAALADRRQSPLERSCAEAAKALTPIALIVAAAAYAGRVWTTGVRPFTPFASSSVRDVVRRRWEVVLSVLMAATPCPLSIGVPVAFLSARSAATKAGITLRSGGALEQLARITCVVLDKTGTLTTGRMKLITSNIFVLSGTTQKFACVTQSALKRVILECLSFVEQGSGSIHAVAQALVRWTELQKEKDKKNDVNVAEHDKEEDEEWIRILETTSTPGCGIMGSVQCRGQLASALGLDETRDICSPRNPILSVAIGSRSFVTSTTNCPAEFGSLARGSGTAGGEAQFEVYFAICTPHGHKPVACGQLMFEDPLRDDAVEFVSALQTRYGLRVVLASGDASPALAKVAEAVGLGSRSEVRMAPNHIPSWCHCMPDGKADLVKRLKAQGERVVMIGDGINDAAALAVADAAVAVGSNDLVAAVSDVIVGGGTAELRKVLGLLKLSRRTLHIARRGVVGGMAVSFVQMVCAATGVLPPFANAVLQECVDLSTVLHALLSPLKFA